MLAEQFLQFFFCLLMITILLMFATHRGGAERVSRGRGGDSGDGVGRRV